MTPEIIGSGLASRLARVEIPRFWRENAKKDSIGVLGTPGPVAKKS